MFQAGQEAPALGDNQRMRQHFANVAQLGAAHAEQAVVGSPMHLGDRGDVELGQQIVTFANGAADGVLDRHHAHVGPQAGDAGCQFAIAGHAQRARLDAALAQVVRDNELRVGPVDPLVDCDRHVQLRIKINEPPHLAEARFTRLLARRCAASA